MENVGIGSLRRTLSDMGFASLSDWNIHLDILVYNVSLSN